MKITPALIAFFFLFFSHHAGAQVSVEGAWYSKNSNNDISLFFRDDGVFSIVKRKVKSEKIKEESRMGTYRVEGHYIKIRWSVSKFESWKIKSIKKDSIMISFRNQPETSKPEFLMFLRIRDEKVIADP